MIFRSLQSYKGFFLKENFELSSKIAVLTGRNGSGKTRFLEAMKNSVEVREGERYIPPEDIKFVPVNEMQGGFVSGYTEEANLSRLNALISCFNRNRERFSSPYDPRDDIHNNDSNLPYSYKQLHKSFELIARRSGKSVWNLEREEIRLNFEGPLNMWDGLDVGGVCNEYIRRNRNNLFFKWLAKEQGRESPYLSHVDFLKQFGHPPWVLFNEVLREIFDGKIFVDSPLDVLSDEVFNPVLREVGTGNSLPVDGLSSGERSLLWLAIVLFKMRYRAYSTFGAPEILLMDEPDAFLHPKMVVKFYSVIELFTDLFNCRVIFTTHSPTTVALAPDNCVYRVSSTEIHSVEKDEAIADLLDGVTQISLNAHNRREVFVESKADVDVYRYIFDKVKSYFPNVDQKISLSFLAAGPKMPSAQIAAKVKQHLGAVEVEDLDRFTGELNGVGDCGQVIAMVEALASAGNKTVRGLIDWDLKNKPRSNIVVSGVGIFYTIENVLLNPIYILKLLNLSSCDRYSLQRYCGKDVSVREWIADWDLLQNTIDSFILELTGAPSCRDVEVRFLGGNALELDRGYLACKGHDLMRSVLDKYQALRAWDKREGALLLQLARVMVDDFGWQHVPECLDQTFSALQR